LGRTRPPRKGQPCAADDRPQYRSKRTEIAEPDPSFEHRASIKGYPACCWCVSISFVSDGFQPLTSCPVCEYDLTGLPEKHCCPECAFEYDPSMRVWIEGRPRWLEHFIAVVLYTLVAGPAILSLFHVINTNKPVRAHVFVFIVATLMFCLWLVSLRFRRRLVISDQGIHIVRGTGKATFHPWADVWVPDPELRVQLPPWVEARNRRLDMPGTSRLRTALFREREWSWSTRRSAIFLMRARHGWETLLSRELVLVPIRRLPRDKRKLAMKEIHERWVRHTDCPD